MSGNCLPQEILRVQVPIRDQGHLTHPTRSSASFLVLPENKLYLHPSIPTFPATRASSPGWIHSPEHDFNPPPRGRFRTPLVTLQRDFLLRLSRNRNCLLLPLQGHWAFVPNALFTPWKSLFSSVNQCSSG